MGWDQPPARSRSATADTSTSTTSNIHRNSLIFRAIPRRSMILPPTLLTQGLAPIAWPSCGRCFRLKTWTRAQSGVRPSSSCGMVDATRSSRVAILASRRRPACDPSSSNSQPFGLTWLKLASSIATSAAAPPSANTGTSTPPVATAVSASAASARLSRNTRATISGTLNPLSVAR